VVRPDLVRLNHPNLMRNYKCDPSSFTSVVVQAGACKKHVKVTEEEERILREFIKNTGKASLDIARKLFGVVEEQTA